jgi:hypothetical protein
VEFVYRRFIVQQHSRLPHHLGIILAITLVVSCGLAPRHVAAQAKPAISAFYAATSAAYKAWTTTTSRARPGKTTLFAPDTKTVAFYVEYGHAVPKHTKFQITVYGYDGYGHYNVLAGRLPSFTPSYANGMTMGKITETPHGSYEGLYRAVLSVDGHATVHTAFEVRITIGGGD